jgi:CheY-like chemotaxis protein
MRLLLVEDHTNTADNLSLILQNAGWFTANMKSAEDALVWLTESPVPRIVVADYYLPGMSGLDLLRALRQNPAWCNIPYILMTAAASTEILDLEDQFYKVLKGNKLLHKPFRTEDLLKFVHEITGLSKTG